MRNFIFPKLAVDVFPEIADRVSLARPAVSRFEI
jgi:hypothetical protein